MDKKFVVLLIIWMVLAVCNAASLFVVSPFLHVCNYVFAGYNGIVFAFIFNIIVDMIKGKTPTE